MISGGLKIPFHSVIKMCYFPPPPTTLLTLLATKSSFHLWFPWTLTENHRQRNENRLFVACSSCSFDAFQWSSSRIMWKVFQWISPTFDSSPLIQCRIRVRTTNTWSLGTTVAVQQQYNGEYLPLYSFCIVMPQLTASGSGSTPVRSATSFHRVPLQLLRLFVSALQPGQIIYDLSRVVNEMEHFDSFSSLWLFCLRKRMWFYFRYSLFTLIFFSPYLFVHFRHGNEDEDSRDRPQQSSLQQMERKRIVIAVS